MTPREWRFTVRLARGMVREIRRPAQTSAQRGKQRRARLGGQGGPDAARAQHRAAAAAAAAALDPEWERIQMEIDAAARAGLGTDSD